MTAQLLAVNALFIVAILDVTRDDLLWIVECNLIDVDLTHTRRSVAETVESARVPSLKRPQWQQRHEVLFGL